MFQRFIGCIKSADFDTLFVQGVPKKVLTDIPHICHERHKYSCKFFWAGVNFYRFNAKNWHFRQILREKVAFFFYRFNAKNWRFSV